MSQKVYCATLEISGKDGCSCVFLVCFCGYVFGSGRISALLSACFICMRGFIVFNVMVGWVYGVGYGEMVLR